MYKQVFSIFSAAFFLALVYPMAVLLGAWAALAYVLAWFAGLIACVQVLDASFPVVKTLLRRSYFKAKFKQDEKGMKGLRLFFNKAYLGVLKFFIIHLKSTQDSFEVIKHDYHDKYKKSVQGTKDSKKFREFLEQEFLALHAHKKRKTVHFSLSFLTSMVVVFTITGFITTLIFPNIYNTKAADYTWVQEDWSGGQSGDTATHPGDATGWDEYYYADANITTTTATDGSGNEWITLDDTTSEIVEDSDDDFGAGSAEKIEQSYPIIVVAYSDKLRLGLGMCGQSLPFYWQVPDLAECQSLCADEGFSVASEATVKSVICRSPEGCGDFNNDLPKSWTSSGDYDYWAAWASSGRTCFESYGDFYSPCECEYRGTSGNGNYCICE